MNLWSPDQLRGRKGAPAAARPAWRDAQRVREITPLFCEKVVLGILVQSAEMNDAMPSFSRPPCTLSWMSCPCTCTCESHTRI